MSRIGKHPVQIPAGVTAEVNGQTVKVKGSKGELERTFTDAITITLDGDVITVGLIEGVEESNAQQGLTRTLIQNMVTGVSEGFERKLELIGVGYRATLKGSDLELALGYSHPVPYKAPENITFEVPDNTHINVKGINKEQVGQVAAEIRAKRPPEPYKGKGIRYEGEYVRRKLGKAAK